MSFISKLKEIIEPTENQLDDEPMDDEEYEEEEEYVPQQQPVAAPKNISYGSSLELKVVRPEGFEKVNSIADLLLEKKTVVLNLENTNKEAAKKLLDFLTGVAYAISGSIKRVSNSTFIITPHNVNISGEQLQEIEDKDTDNNAGQLF